MAIRLLLIPWKKPHHIISSTKNQFFVTTIENSLRKTLVRSIKNILVHFLQQNFNLTIGLHKTLSLSIKKHFRALSLVKFQLNKGLHKIFSLSIKKSFSSLSLIKFQLNNCLLWIKSEKVRSRNLNCEIQGSKGSKKLWQNLNQI